MHVATLAHVEGPPLDRLDELIWIGDIPALGATRCPDRAAIVTSMRRTTTSYRALAKAANRNDRRAYNRARTDVRRAEAGVRSALRHLDRRSYTVG